MDQKMACFCASLILALTLFLSACGAATVTPERQLPTIVPPEISTLAPTPSPEIVTPPPSKTENTVSPEQTLSVHFIDVGQADVALVLCGGQSILIDGGNVADSSLMVAYLKKQGITKIDYMVNTHAHEDHVGGLAGALNGRTVGTICAGSKL